MAIILSEGVLDYDTILNSLAWEGNCTHPAGHCYGSDGGSGIPDNLKVPVGRSGSFEVWHLNKQKTEIIRKLQTLKCQYCEKYWISHEIVDQILDI